MYCALVIQQPTGSLIFLRPNYQKCWHLCRILLIDIKSDGIRKKKNKRRLGPEKEMISFVNSVCYTVDIITDTKRGMLVMCLKISAK